MTAKQRVITYVTSKIGNREWGPGHKLPSTAELAETLGVSQSTAVNALNSLKDRGIIVGRAGSGRFVPGGESSPTATDNTAP